MHFDGWWCERVVGRKHKGAPILPIVVWCIRRTGEDIVPSCGKISTRLLDFGGVETHSKMLDSEGWATIYGGGFLEMV